MNVMGQIKKILPESIYKIFLDTYENHVKDYINLSYSQEGEDLILSRLFEGKKEGFFIDVGALHPKRFSNTYLFYKLGWRGINIEPRPGSMKLFNKFRRRDINLELPIYDDNIELTYYMFNEPALNSFSKEICVERKDLRDYKLIGEKKLNTKKLVEILDEYITEDVDIDFLTIDVEGLDYNVLNSNDWKKYRPTVVLFEDIVFKFQDLEQSKSCKLLVEAGYSLWAKTFNTIFFISEEKKDLLKR